MQSLAAYKLLIGLALLVFVLDQATKLLILHTLPFGAFYPPQCIEVIPGFFNLVHVGNTGAAWSLFSGHSEILALVGILALFLLWFCRKTLQLERIQSQWAFGLIIGGIIGNIIDRFRYGHVIDFLDFHIADWYWPSFNIADSGITVGVALYVLFSFLQKSDTSES
jgi:signal peptidase II